MYVKFQNELFSISHIKQGPNNTIGLPICTRSISGFKVYLERECNTQMYDYSGFTNIISPFDGSYTYFSNPSLTTETIIPIAEDTTGIELLNRRNALQNQIEEFKNRLSETDYRIIKCTEFSLVGEICGEYDIFQLHTERQSIRSEINRLQSELEDLNN